MVHGRTMRPITSWIFPWPCGDPMTYESKKISSRECSLTSGRILDIGVGIDANITKTQRLHTELRFTYGHTYLGAKNSSSHIEILGFEDNLQANLKTLSLTVSYMFDFDLKKSKMGKSTKDREIR